MKALVLTIPLPPSTNKLFANVPGKGRVRTADYRKWSALALNYAWMSKPPGGFPFFEGAFVLEISIPQKMRGDASNRVKAVEDWLKKPLGVIEDDRHAHKVSIERSPDVEPSFCKVFTHDVPMLAKEAA